MKKITIPAPKTPEKVAVEMVREDAIILKEYFGSKDPDEFQNELQDKDLGTYVDETSFLDRFYNALADALGE